MGAAPGSRSATAIHGGREMPILSAKSVVKIFGPAHMIPHARRLLEEQGLSAAEVRRRTGCTVAVHDVSFDVEEGECFVMMGLSGSGKSTLLRCLNGLNLPTSGSVEVGGVALDRLSPQELRLVRRQKVAMVFQNFALLPHRTVLDNVAFGLEIRGDPPAARRRRALEALEQVGLADWAEAKPSQLSGGMAQRVGLARALATDAPILLMDEPFSALDPLIRREMQDDLLRLRNILKRTIVFVSHDPNEAAKLGDRIGIMQNGRLLQVGKMREFLLHPATDYVRSFMETVDERLVLTASDVMRPAHVVREEAGVAAAREYVRRENLQHVLVLGRDGGLRGQVEAAHLATATDGTGLDRLTTPVASVGGETSLAELAKAFTAGRDVAAVVGPDGAIVGEVTVADVLGAAQLVEAAAS
jgi:glycine betaine/proline transport system ATP-binding protein